jgi:Flp pilus assembly pilin Flp
VRKTLLRFWPEESGATYTMEVILVATLVVIGLTVGLGRLRVALQDELCDLANAIGSLNQSFIVPAGDVCTCEVFTSGSGFLDDTEHCDCDCIDLCQPVKDHNGNLDKSDVAHAQG